MVPREERFDEDVDILERADVPLYSSDDEHADTDALPNLPVLAKALLPPAPEATGQPATSATAPSTAEATAGYEAQLTFQRPPGAHPDQAAVASPRSQFTRSCRAALDDAGARWTAPNTFSWIVW